jgi:hypothetical protein
MRSEPLLDVPMVTVVAAVHPVAAALGHVETKSVA